MRDLANAMRSKKGKIIKAEVHIAASRDEHKEDHLKCLIFRLFSNGEKHWLDEEKITSVRRHKGRELIIRK